MYEEIARKAGLTGADHKYLGLILQHKELTAWVPESRLPLAST